MPDEMIFIYKVKHTGANTPATPPIYINIVLREMILYWMIRENVFFAIMK